MHGFSSVTAQVLSDSSSRILTVKSDRYTERQTVRQKGRQTDKLLMHHCYTIDFECERQCVIIRSMLR